MVFVVAALMARLIRPGGEKGVLLPNGNFAGGTAFICFVDIVAVLCGGLTVLR